MRGLRFASRSRPSQDIQNAIENDRTNTVLQYIESSLFVLCLFKNVLLLWVVYYSL